MTKNKRAREFCVYECYDEILNTREIDLKSQPPTVGEIHVIEYSEVERLESELETMTEVNKNLCATNLELHSEIDKLEQQNELLKKQLDKCKEQRDSYIDLNEVDIEEQTERLDKEIESLT